MHAARILLGQTVRELSPDKSPPDQAEYPQRTSTKSGIPLTNFATQV